MTVLTTIVGKAVAQIFAEFEDVPDPASIQGSGDLKYHLAPPASTSPRRRAGHGRRGPNPSHLEAVDPSSREWSAPSRPPRRHGSTRLRHAVLIHGDAAFAGQGVVAETLNMSQLHGYRTGGTVARRHQQPDRLHDEPIDARRRERRPTAPTWRR